MKKIEITKVKEGMRLCKNVYTQEWRILLPSGAVLTEGYITKLKEMEYNYLYVEDETVGQLLNDEVLSEEFLIRVYNELNELFTLIGNERPFSLTNLVKLVDEVIYSLINHVNAAQLVDYGPKHDYLIGHSVNTCILSIITGLAMGLTTAELSNLGLGAILHDIGIKTIDKSILKRIILPESPQYILLKKHVEKGFELLRGRSDISLIASHIAFQHHEKWDGSGYPRGIKEENIHKFGRIVAIAETYDALITDRIYRKRVMPHEAIEIIVALGRTQFDSEIVEVFTRNVPPYPVGTEVVLNNSMIGVVIDVNKSFPTRPIIRITRDEFGNENNNKTDISLIENTSIFINKVL